MTEDAVEPEALLAALTDELRLAEGWRNAMVEAVNHHWSIGRLLKPVTMLGDLTDDTSSADMRAEYRSQLVHRLSADLDELGRQWARIESFVYGSPVFRDDGTDLAGLFRRHPSGSVADHVARCRVAIPSAQAYRFLRLVMKVADPAGRVHLDVYSSQDPPRHWARLRVLDEAGRPDIDVDDPVLVHAGAVVVRRHLDRGVVAEFWLPCQP